MTKSDRIALTICDLYAKHECRSHCGFFHEVYVPELQAKNVNKSILLHDIFYDAS